MRSRTFVTLAVLLAVVSAGSALDEKDVVVEHRKLAADVSISSDPCWTVRCPGDLPKCVVLEDGTVQCVKDPCADVKCKDGEVCYEQEVQCIKAPCLPIPTCIKDPCVDLVCNAASTCEIDGGGNAYCLPLPGNAGNPVDNVTCAAVTCPIDAPICIILEDGSADCIKDPCADVKCKDGEVCYEQEVQCIAAPCLPIPTCIKDPCVDLVCNAASTCEIDGGGNAYCLPLPGNPGNPVDNVTCAAVTCPIDAPICIILEDGSADCIKDPCADVKCKDGEVCYEQEVQCIKAPCLPVPTCIKDPCVDLVCSAASTCEIDGSGNAYCLPLPGNPGNPVDNVTCAAVTCPIDAPICTILADGTPECSKEGDRPIISSDPCWTVRCPGDLPKCVVLEDGTVQCVKDPCADVKCKDGEVCYEQEVQCIKAPCLPIPTCIKDPCVDLVCNAASTCEIDGGGNAYCLPLPGNPGNPVDNVTCAAVTCPIDAPICTILADGTPECSKEGDRPMNTQGKPDWWKLVKKNFQGKGLSRCKRRKNVAPADDSKCNKKKDTVCFFGNQVCESVGAFPDTRCKCTRGKWACTSAIDCPLSTEDKLN